MHEEVQDEGRVVARRKGSGAAAPKIATDPRGTKESPSGAQPAGEATGAPDSAQPVEQVVLPAQAVNLKASFEQLVSAAAELGAKPKLTAGEELWRDTEEYYLRLQQARISGRSSDGGAAALAAHVRKCKELIESVHKTLYHAWPLGHIQETLGFRLEGEMLQMKKDPTNRHLAMVLDATSEYLRSLTRRS